MSASSVFMRKVHKLGEHPTCEVRRIPLLQRRVNRAGRGKRRTRPAQLVIVLLLLLLPSSGALELAEALLQSRDPLSPAALRENHSPK